MKYNIIAIEREFGSGGREIGREVAKQLGIPSYGGEILKMVAERYQVPLNTLQKLEERTTNSFLYSINLLGKLASGEAADLANEDKLFLAEAAIIEGIAKQGPAVIVGHCGGYILRERNDVLNVFLHADWDARKKRAVEVYGVPKEQTDTVLKKLDRRRANFYSVNAKCQWKDAKNYHMVLDSGKLGLERCVALITTAAGGT